MRISHTPEFDDATELFLSNAPTLPEFEPLALEPDARASRRALGRGVIAAMVVCTIIVAYAYAGL